MYNPASVHADDFINHDEILETLEEARVQSRDHARVEEILSKAALCKGLTHREAAILMDCDDPVLEEKIYALARQIKEKFYGNRIVLFAPLYLSNYCINGCVYCPYHAKNRTIPRKKLTQPEIEAEVRALIRTGHKRLALLILLFSRFYSFLLSLKKLYFASRFLELRLLFQRTNL